MNCKHGIPQEFCGFCNPQESIKPKSPKQRKEKTVHGAGAIPPEDISSALAFICIRNRRNHASHSQLNSHTTHVHVSGMLFIWLLEKIKQLAPNVQQVQVIPGIKRKMTKTYLDAAQRLGIKIVYGHAHPEMKWSPGEARRTQSYLQQQKFFKTLEGEQKDLFHELIRFGFEIAQMAKDYYLGDEDQPMFAHDLCEKYGFTQTAEYVISAYLYGLMHYLDPTFSVPDRSIQFSNNLSRKVKRIREEINSDTAEKELVAKFGIEKLPDKFSFSRIEDLELILTSLHNGRLNQLQAQHPTWHRILVLRFGLENFPEITTCRSLDEIAQTFDHFKSRERARQLEQKALEYLQNAEVTR